MKKRKSKKSRNKSKHFLGLNKALTYIILSFSLLAFITTLIVVAYNMGFEEAVQTKESEIYKSKQENNILRKRLQQTLHGSQFQYEKVEPNLYAKHTMKHALKSVRKVETNKHSLEPIKTTALTPKHAFTTHKPMLAIILDDVSYASEVRAVKALGIKVNFSFFPPTPRHPQTAKLASQESFYMVHLPLEAMSFNAEEPRTLRVGDNQEKMRQRLRDIKKDFPRLQYVNNHTGSKFTSDYKAVKKLYNAARSVNIDIVDSRTIASTKLPQVYEEAGRTLLFRDVFLDHKADVSYICGQIKLAVKRAIDNGKAIAIGHPRHDTIKALHRCKAYFEPVELVYITQL